MNLKFADKSQAFRYMGYSDDNIPDNIIKLTDECENELFKVLSPLYNLHVFDVRFFADGVHLCGSNFVMRGNDIKNHLDGCDKAVLICATLGVGADRLIKQLSVSDMTESFITDALASALIEQVCDRAEAEIREKFPDRFMTWRFSPGYGDFPIEQQKEFLAVTNASKQTGIYLSDGGMLIPSKSVTAVIGLSEKPLTKKKSGCMTCNMKDRCSFRKRGVRCEF